MKLLDHLHGWRNKLLLAGSACLILLGFIFIWTATFRIPDLSDLATRKVSQSTKIYDRTGQILLYDMAQNVKRTLVPFEDISPDIKNATLSIEDKNFYTHGGIDPQSILRALLVDITSLSSSQGGIRHLDYPRHPTAWRDDEEGGYASLIRALLCGILEEAQDRSKDDQQ